MEVKNRILTVNGYAIKDSSLYKISPKYDASAPDGFREKGTTKVLGDGIADFISCHFTDNGNQTGDGVYDTGMYVGSSCNRGMSKEEEAIFVSAVQELIVEPYERKHGEGILHFRNFDFWDNYRVRLNHNKVFDPRDVDHLLELYIGLITHALTPEGMEGKPAYRNSSFLIEDVSKSVEFSIQKSTDIVSAIGTFTGLLKNKPTVLYNVLRFSKMIDNNTNVGEEVLTDTFYKWITQSGESKKRVAAFMSAVDMANDKSKEDIISLYTELLNGFRNNIITKSGGFYFYKNQQIGTSLKEAAKKINADPELSDVKEALLIPSEKE